MIKLSDMIKLPPYQYSVIIGLLLSDPRGPPVRRGRDLHRRSPRAGGGLLIFASATNKNARLGFSQSLSKSHYLFYVFNQLSHYCSSYPALKKSTRKKGDIPTYALYFLYSILAFYRITLSFLR